MMPSSANLQRVNRSRGEIAHLPDNKARDQEGNY